MATRSPFVYWSQTESVVSLRVDIKQAQDAEIDLADRTLFFSARGLGAAGESQYEFRIQLHNLVDPQKSFYKIIDRNVEFMLTKREPHMWPCLLHTNIRPAWLKVDFDRMTSGTSSEEEGENEDGHGPDTDEIDQWVRPPQDQQNSFRNLGPYKDFGRGRKSAKRAEELRKTYLFIYNLFQFVGFLFVLIVLGIRYTKEGEKSIESTYSSLGSLMKLLTGLQILEVLHPLLGFTPGGAMMPLIQLLGRAITIFVAVGGEPRIQTRPVVLYLFLVYSFIEIFRYSYYMLRVFNVNVGLVTWLRYSAWIPLYPCGFICEGVILLRDIPFFEETGRFSVRLPNPWNWSFDFPTAIRVYLLIGFFPAMYMMMSHMYRQRVKVIGPRTHDHFSSKTAKAKAKAGGRVSATQGTRTASPFAGDLDDKLD